MLFSHACMLSFLVILELLVCTTNLPSCKQSSWICFGTCCHFDTGNVLQAANPTGRMTIKQRSGAEVRQGSTGSPPQHQRRQGTFQSHASGSPSRQSKGVPGRRPRPHEQGGSKFLRRSAAAYAAGDAAARAAPRYNLPMMDPSPPEPYRSGQRICRLTDLTTNNEVRHS